MASQTRSDLVNFTQEQVAANLKAQRQLADLLPVFDDADKCGIDTTGYRAIAAGLQAQLQEIHSNFMPKLKQG